MRVSINIPAAGQPENSWVEPESPVEVATVTDTGKERAANQDSVSVVIPESHQRQPKGLLLLVADGLGGHRCGEQASRIAARDIPHLYFENPSANRLDALLAAFSTANARIRSKAQERGECTGMATTVVACVLANQHMICTHVGDSRAYVIRAGSVVFRTRDHSHTRKRLQGTGAAFPRVLTHALGGHTHTAVDTSINRIAVDDRLMLCTDGLTDAVPDDMIEQVLSKFSPADASQELLRRARARGAKDNISIVIARILDIPRSDTVRIRITTSTGML